MKPRSIQPLALAVGLLASMTAFASPHGTGNGIIASGPLDHTLVDSSGGTSFNSVVVPGGAGSDPSATVAPAYLSLTATVNASASATLTIANATGSSPLTYAITSSTTGAVQKPQLIGPTAGSESDDDALAPKLQYLEALRNRPPATFTPHVIPPSHLGAGSSPRAPDGEFAFVADDGTYEAATGLQNATNTTAAVYANRFTATGALTIDSISVEWPSLAGSGSSGVTVGMQPNLVVYYDAAATGDMTNAVRLGNDQIVTIDSLDDFQTYATNFSVPGAGDVYIGFVDEWALVLGGYDGLVSAAALDTSADPSVTYVSGSSNASVLTDIVDLANNDLNGTGASFGIGGAWLVRATGGGGGGAPCTGPAVDWLTATPASGAVEGGNAAMVTVTATPAAAGLAPGSYTADLCLTTNDPTQALIVVPVSLSVTPRMCSGGSDDIFCFGFDGSGSTTGPDVVYGNRNNFLAAIAPGYYQNGFDDADGQSGTMQYSDPISGIAYTVDAPTHGLWNGHGFISPNNSGDPIVVTFTGTPVTAIGGNFWTVDSLINPFPGFEVVITLSDGTTATLTSNGPGDFRGFTATQPIASISIDAPPPDPNLGDNVWPAMDNLIVGSTND